MIIECPECETRYETAADIPPEGRKVRCAKCTHVWLATDVSDSEPADDIAPESEETDEISEDFADMSDEGSDEDNDLFNSEETSSIPAIVPNPGEMEDLEFRSSDEESNDDEGGEATDEWESEEISSEDNEVTDPGDGATNDEPLDQADLDALFAADTDLDSDPEPEQESEIESEVEDFETEAKPKDEDQETEEKESDFDEVDFGADFSEEGANFSEENEENTVSQNKTWADYADELPESSEPALQKETIPKTNYLGLVAGWATLCLVVTCMIGSAYIFRTNIVRALPATAGVYESLGMPVNIRGFEFHRVTYSWKMVANKNVLQVEGIIINLTNRPSRVPTVVFAFRDESGKELYHWAERVRQRPLPSRQSTSFITRIPAPPVAVRSLQVRFAKDR